MILKKNTIILLIFLLLIAAGSLAIPIMFNDHNSISQVTGFSNYIDDCGVNIRFAEKVIEPIEPIEPQVNISTTDTKNEALAVDNSEDNEEVVKPVISEPTESVNTETTQEHVDTTDTNNSENSSENNDDSSTEKVETIIEETPSINDDYVQELIEENKENIEDKDLETGTSIYEKLDTEFIFGLTDDGLTDEEKQQIKDHMHEVLTDEEYDTVFELLSKYIGLTE